MGRPKPVYNEIRQLRKQLDAYTNHHTSESATSTTTGSHSKKQCRVTYRRLLEIFSDAQKRQLLNEEAMSDADYMEYMQMETTTSMTTSTVSTDIDTDDVTIPNTTTTRPKQKHHHITSIDDDDDDDDFISASNHTTSTSTTPNATGTATHPVSRSPPSRRFVSRSIRARQRLALSEMWKSLVTSSILCAQQLLRLSRTTSSTTSTATTRKRKQISSSTTSNTITTASSSTATKYNLEDVNFPFKLLQLCYHFDPVLDEPLLPPPFSSTSPDHSTPLLSPHATHFLPSKLGRDQSKLLYQYCVQLLADIDHHRSDHSPDNYDGETSHLDEVERTVLSMLAYIVGKVELVASYYRAIPHIRHIMLRIVQPRLLRGPTANSNALAMVQQQQIKLTAAKIWYTLFHTCSLEHIGIGLQLLLPDAFDIFAAWCQQQPSVYNNKKNKNTSSASSSSTSTITVELATYLLNTITILTKENRDLCIASWQRHGYVLRPFLSASYEEYQQQTLKFATSSAVTTHSSIATALHDFLLQYMYVQKQSYDAKMIIYTRRSHLSLIFRNSINSYREEVWCVKKRVNYGGRCPAI